MKISKNIYSQNFTPFKAEDSKKINILSIGNINQKLLKNLLNAVKPSQNGLIQYPLPFPNHAKVKNIIADISLSNNTLFENEEMNQDIQKIKFKKIFELTFYETVILTLCLNHFWGNQNLIIPLHEKLTKNQFEIIENTKFNKIYISKERDNLNSSKFHVLSPAGSLHEKLNPKNKINIYTFETLVSPQEYLDKGIFIWETSLLNNGWKISTLEEEVSKIKEIDNFSKFSKLNIDL